MKVLYSAFECNPYRGSEAFCGWSWVINMRKYHEVFVITRTENRIDIENYCKQNNINDIHFFYCDINEKINLYYKKGKFYMQYYVLWQNVAYKVAKKICNENKIDIIHHITLGDFRIIGKMSKINSNFIFGPLGGAQYIPKSLSHYARGHKLQELFRKVVNSSRKFDNGYKRALKKTKKIFCANEETLLFMQSFKQAQNKCSLLTENGVNLEKLGTYKAKENSGEIKIIWLGRIVYRKGIELLIDSVKYIETEKKFSIYIYGNDEGNEVEKLEKKCKDLGIKNQIHFEGKVNFEEIDQIYQNADFFVFPSLRETTGTVIFEAMSHGLPIVGLNQNGLKLIASNESAILVDLKSENVPKMLGQAIQKLIEDDELRKKMSKNAFMEIQKYTWEKKIMDTLEIYNEILKNDNGGNYEKD